MVANALTEHEETIARLVEARAASRVHAKDATL